MSTQTVHRVRRVHKEDGRERKRTRGQRIFKLLCRVALLAIVLVLLAGCDAPDSSPVTSVTCNWIKYAKTVGMSLASIGLVVCFMIVVVAYAGAGVVWAGLYQFAQRVLNGAVVALVLLAVGLPAFWWIMGKVGGTICP